MARIRSVHPGLFTDEAFVTLSPIARVLLIGLWTECDDQGIFEWKPVTIKMRLLSVDNLDVNVVLAELPAANQVRRFTACGREYGAVRNFCKYQRPKKPKCVHPMPSELRTYVGLTVDGSEPSEVEGDPVPPKAETPPQREEGGGRMDKEDIRAVAGAPRPDDRFEEFWKAYPKRDGANPREPARKKYLAAVKSGADPNEILASVKRFADEARSKGQIGTPYVAQAMTWLGQQRWGDYEPQEEAAPQGFYAKAESQEIDAWDAYRLKSMGKKYPRDRDGGWNFPTQWPPDHAEQEVAA